MTPATEDGPVEPRIRSADDERASLPPPPMVPATSTAIAAPLPESAPTIRGLR